MSKDDYQGSAWIGPSKVKENPTSNDAVPVSRAQYEALMAAAKALAPFQSGNWGRVTAWIVEGAEVCATRQEGIQEAARFSRLRGEADEALATLRAAGILEEK